jgi:hypothetical protein
MEKIFLVFMVKVWKKLENFPFKFKKLDVVRIISKMNFMRNISFINHNSILFFIPNGLFICLMYLFFMPYVFVFL